MQKGKRKKETEDRGVRHSVLYEQLLKSRASSEQVRDRVHFEESWGSSLLAHLGNEHVAHAILNWEVEVRGIDREIPPT